MASESHSIAFWWNLRKRWKRSCSRST